MRKLFRNWSFIRMLRLAFAAFLGFEVFRTQQWFFVVFALFFLFQALFNLSCCGYSGCEIQSKKNDFLND